VLCWILLAHRQLSAGEMETTLSPFYDQNQRGFGAYSCLMCENPGFGDKVHLLSQLVFVRCCVCLFVRSFLCLFVSRLMCIYVFLYLFIYVFSVSHSSIWGMLCSLSHCLDKHCDAYTNSTRR
jgi:hypothetical protein